MIVFLHIFFATFANSTKLNVPSFKTQSKTALSFVHSLDLVEYNDGNGWKDWTYN